MIKVDQQTEQVEVIPQTTAVKMIGSEFLTDFPLTDPNESKMAIHQHIASEIANEINDEDTPSSIAVIGEWGSGKSTVLRFLESELSSKKQPVVFFVFDAWTHAGHALRKDFLLSLGELFLQNSPDDKGAKWWQKEQKKILGTEMITTTIEDRKYSLLVSWFSIAIGLTFLLQAIAKFVEGAWTSVPVVVTSGLPFLISVLVATVLTCVLSYGRRREGDQLIADDGTSKLDDLLMFLIGQPGGSVTQVVQKSPDLDTVEFEQLYSKLLEAIGVGNRRLVIAIDNLDRLSDEKLSHAWESIQVFTGSNLDNVGATHKPWIILPIARRAFDELAGKSAVGSGKGIGMVSKLFTRQFELPQPITTDWKAVFIDYFSKAFPDAGRECVLSVFSIVNMADTGVTQRTPREIKRFINEMVSMSRLHDDISLTSIAIYCYYNTLSDRDTADIIQALLSGKTPNLLKMIASSTHDPDECKKELSMLNYGLFDRAKAQEIFASQAISQAASSASEPNIKAIVGSNPGTWNDLYPAVESLLESSDLREAGWYQVFMRAFFTYSPQSDEDKHGALEIQKLLLSHLRHSKWPVCDGFSECIIPVMTNPAISDDLLKEILAFIVDESKQWTDELSSTEILTDSISVWIRETANLINAIEARGLINMTLPFGDMKNGYWIFVKALADNNIQASWLNQTIEISDEAFFAISEGLMDGLANKDYLDTTSIWGLVRTAPPVYAEVEPTFSEDSFLQSWSSKGDVFWVYALFWLMEHKQKIVSPRGRYIMSLFKLDYANVFEQLRADKPIERLYTIASFAYLLETADNENHAGFHNAVLNNIEIQSAIPSLAVQFRVLCPDVFDRLIAALSINYFQQLALELLLGMWKSEDSRSLDITSCLKIASVMDGGQHYEFGNKLALENRVNDLVGTRFNKELVNFYYGFSQQCSDDVFKNWLAPGLREFERQDWDDFLEQADHACVLLARFCGTLPIELEQSINDSIAAGNVGLVFSDDLIDLVSDVKGLQTAYSTAFAHDTAWKDLVEKLGSNYSMFYWFISLSTGDRVNIVKKIITARSECYCKWLLSILQRHDEPKKLFYGSLQEVRRKINKVGSHKSMPKVSKAVFRDIHALLA